MKKYLSTILTLSLFFITTSIYAGTPLYSTKVDTMLESMINSTGKFISLKFADGTTQTTAGGSGNVSYPINLAGGTETTGILPLTQGGWGTDTTGTIGVVAGKIGIGTTTPATKLHVIGTITASDMTVTNMIVTGTATFPSNETTGGTKTVTIAAGSSFVIATTGNGSQFRRIEGTDYKMPVTLVNWTGSVTVTGTTTETTLKSFDIPGNAIKPNSSLECYVLFSSVSGTASTRTYKSNGSFAGALLNVTPTATHTTTNYISHVVCRGSTTSQIVRPGHFGFGATTNIALNAKSVDITGTVTIGYAATLTNVANDVTLEHVRIILYE